MLARYQREIQKLPENLIDCAFLPVDYRLGASYDYGARYFLEHVKKCLMYFPCICGEVQYC